MVAGMLAGADSIDDLDVLRHGGMSKVVHRGPGAVDVGHVPALVHVRARPPARRRRRPGAGRAGRGGAAAAGRRPEAMAFVDVDDTIREVHGYQKQGAAYGYCGVKGLNAQLAALSSPTCAPVIAARPAAQGQRRLRARRRPADRLDAVATARAAGVTGQVMVRADSGYYRRDVIAAAVAGKAWFSVTVRMNPAVQPRRSRRSPRTAWTTIKYPRGDLGRAGAAVDLRSRRSPRPPSPRSPPTQEAAGDLPARRAPRPSGCNHRRRQQRPGRAVHDVASPRVRHQLHPAPPSRPTRPTATTPSSSRSSPS